MRLVKIDESGCWLWQGQISRNGYGRCRVGPGKPLVAAHRVSYEHYIGPIPEGLQLDHVKERGCTHRNCVNPEHLEPVTGSTNTMRQDHAERRVTECPKGHPYDEENTILTPQGHRRCRECDRARKRR